MGQIVTAEPQHLPHLIKLWLASHIEGHGDDIAEFSFDRTSEALYGLMEDPDGFLMLSEGGLFGGKLIPIMYDPETKFAREIIWYSMDGTGGKLYKAFEQWATHREAKFILMSENLKSANPGRLSRFYNSMGYSPFETLFMKEL